MSFLKKFEANQLKTVLLIKCNFFSQIKQNNAFTHFMSLLKNFEPNEIKMVILI